MISSTLNLYLEKTVDNKNLDTRSQVQKCIDWVREQKLGK